MLKVCTILRLFCNVFRENDVLYVIIYTPFAVIRSGMVLFYVFQVFDYFTLKLTVIECNLTLYGHPQGTMPIEERKNRRSSRQSR